MLQEFSQQVEKTAKAAVNEIHTALPGEILSFNPAAGTATVKPAGKYITSGGVALKYPTITDVPVIFPFCQSAGIGMAFPVKKKDDCLIIISEVELDAWRSGAESDASLRFDLTSAVAVPGLLNGGGELFEKACSNDAVVIHAGATELMVKDSGVEITGDLKVKGTIQVEKKDGDETVKIGPLDLEKRVHLSASPGTKSSKPQNG